MSDNKQHSQVDEKVETTGHSWDGIEELNNPLPRWWLWFFYGTIAFGILWSILYPAWPLVNGATQGLLEYDSRERVDEDITKFNKKNAPLDQELVATDYPAIVSNEALANYANQGGEAIFNTYCSQCHGAGGAGNVGYPNLLDNDWLYGGTYADIEYTVRHGVNDEADPETRTSEMIGFVDILSPEEISAVANFVMSLSEEPQDASLVSQGAAVFAENCTSCHGENAMGNQEIGAPNLTDVIWLYKGDYETIVETIKYGRKNAMPHWGERLNDAQIKQIVTYVHQRGGGE